MPYMKRGGPDRRKTMRHLLLILCVLAAHGAAKAEPERPYRVAVQMDEDRRATLDDFARRHQIDRSELKRRFGATGLVRCGGAIGTAQLTLRNDIITTAAHVLIGSDGQPRASCTFQPAGGGAAVAIDAASVRAGSRSPLSEPATRDWAVARLTQPIANATPYGLAPAGSKPGAVFLFAGGNKRADQMGAERCHARGMLGT